MPVGKNIFDEPVKLYTKVSGIDPITLGFLNTYIVLNDTVERMFPNSNDPADMLEALATTFDRIDREIRRRHPEFTEIEDDVQQTLRSAAESLHRLKDLEK